MKRWLLWLFPVFCLILVPPIQGAPPDDGAGIDATEAPRFITPRDQKKVRPATEGASQGARNNPASTGWWTTTAGLLAVLGLIVFGAKVFKKHLPGTTRFLPPEAVQVLGKRPLDYKQMIYLLRCGSKILVVGASQQGLVTLGEITEPVEVDYLAGLCKPGEDQSTSQTFAQLFRQFQPQPTPNEPSRRERSLRQPSQVEATLTEEVHG